MFASIAAFELRYQFRNPVFWVVAILFFLLTFGATTVEQIQIGSGGNVHVNSPVAIGQIHLLLSLFFMFVTTAFVANVIVRDDESGFGPMVKSTRVSKFDYLIARFVGAVVAAGVAFAVVPLAIWLGSMMPWLDAETVGPNRFADYAFAYFALALPNVLLTAAIFFAVATMTRSMMYSYVGVVVFLVLYVVVNTSLRALPQFRELAGYVEPFGIAAFSNVTRYWTGAESNGAMPALAGPLLVNRLIWCGAAVAALVVAFLRFSFADRGMSKRALRRQAKATAKLAAAAPVLVDVLPPTRPEAAGWARLIARTRFETAQVFKSPAFFVLLAIGVFNAGGSLLLGNEIYGTPARPLTFEVITTLRGAFGIFPIIIAIYYSGELVWRDRERKMHEIVDATSLPNWAYLVPKTIAVAGALIATLLVAVLTGIGVQLYRGQTDLALAEYVGWYLVPDAVDSVILAVLAVFVQALSPGKYVGWGIMVVYLVATITLSTIGFEHPLYTYGNIGTVLLSDMNGDNVGGALAWWLRLYWGAIALALAVLAHLLWRRGTIPALAPRLRRLPSRLIGVPGVVIFAGALIAAATGGYIFYNTNILNEYRTRDDVDERRSDYEKKYLAYETLLQPSVTDIRLAIDLFPAEHRVEASGRYALVNDSGAPIDVLHVRLADPDIEIVGMTIPGARLEANDVRNSYRIYRLAVPLAPGATTSLDFRTRRWYQGFRASNPDTSVIDNGSFLNNADFAPQLGMSRSGLLSDRVKRRKYGLPSELRMAKLEDRTAQRRNGIADADWVTSDITVSTVAGQTPIAPGRKVADVVAGGRRTARFVSTAPILGFFSVQSAAYAERSIDAGGVRLTVFHDPKHAYNVDRMLAAMRLSLDTYRAAFGPYQFDHLRVVEFPGYATFAQSFAGTIPYSEKIGFIADNRNADEIDYVTYVTAHEVAHQYWGHQIVGADMQGSAVLVETLAQYSAMIVMKRLYGDDKMRRFLKYELDNYLRSRSGEAIEELPLARVEAQGYIYYRKGSVAMYLLQDRLGEDRVDAVLRQLLDRTRFKGAPYARSVDLIDGLKSLARDDAERQLVADLFERITIFDLKARAAKTRKLPDGRFETVLTLSAGKSYADGKGRETTARLADTIDVGLFAARPGIGKFGRSDVDLLERRPIVSGTQQVRMISKRRPKFAGVDPYNKYIDRDSDDNVVAVID